VSNRKHLLAQEARRLEQVVERREAAVTEAQAALKEHRGKDPEGNLARRVNRAARARARLQLALDREAGA
jgi:hypothetical protein